MQPISMHLVDDHRLFSSGVLTEPGDDFRVLAVGVSDAAVAVIAIETRVPAVLRKLQLPSRYELTRWASDRRLV
ncbi:MAG TPA: hypothetical protein VGA36_00210 [Nitriliruptorales bacterium]